MGPRGPRGVFESQEYSDMADYEPLDLSELCNGGPDLLPSDDPPIIGPQTFRGLPFHVGQPGRGNCFIRLAKGDAALTIPVEATALRVIFAHRLLETDVPQGGQIGRPVADYVFHLSTGEDVTARIRERFQISAFGPPYAAGTYTGAPYEPFQAVPDQKADLYPRYHGAFSDAGNRQTEAQQASARWYYLWSWKNPAPYDLIDSIEIIPRGRPFIVAAVTLGRLEELPFPRDARRPVKIEMTDPALITQPLDVEVEIDRGEATYAHPLPKDGPGEFLKSRIKGWGEPYNHTGNPAYVEVAAVPSATLTVKRGDQTVAQANWGKLVSSGAAAGSRARIEMIDPGKNWVNVTILDDETNQPVPCRVHFRSPDGVPYQPHGHHNHVNSNLDTWHKDVGGDLRLGQITYAYVDGTCQGWQPRGEVIVDVSRGFEYRPLRAKVQIKPGQRRLELRLKRWTNMNDQRWFSGDSHVHFLTPEGAHRESQAEDLNVVNLLQSQWGSLFTNTEDFIGRPSVSRDGNNFVYVGQENRQHFLGHMILWGLKQHIMPWCSDGLGEAEIAGTMETNLSDWADRAHAQGGFVINPHFNSPNAFGEYASLIATGRMDAIELKNLSAQRYEDYYGYLNCGYRLPLVSGTDKMSSAVPVGGQRVYVNIPEDEEFTYESWCRSAVAGRTFITGGPMISFTVDDMQIGDTVQLSSPGTVRVRARAESIFPIHSLQIVQAGKVVASTESRQGARRLELSENIRVDGHTWLAARAGGRGYYDNRIDYGTGAHEIFAHTSPIYVACGGDWRMFDQRVAGNILTSIEGSLAYIRENTRQHPPSLVTHHHGEDDHAAYLERPFIEARNAVHARMHELGITH